jgi:hypothetical protein
MIKSRDRLLKTKNRRTQTFDNFINRESLQFKRVNQEMTVLHNEILDFEMKKILHRANSVSERERERKRERERGRKRERERERARELELINQSMIDEDADNETKIV